MHRLHLSLLALPLLALLGPPQAEAQTVTFELDAVDDPFGSLSQEFGRALGVSGPAGVVGSDDGAWSLERQPSGQWALGAELQPFDFASSVGFGRAVAIDGARLAVGAPLDSASGDQTGSVYLYQRVGQQWFPGAKLFLPSALPQVEFAASLALDGDRLVVGSPRAKSPFFNVRTGLVHVFDRQPSGDWVLDGTLAVPTPDDGLRFGHAVAVEGDRVLVGAPFDQGAAAPGRAFVFERGGNGVWKQTAELVPTAGQGGDRYGSAVALTGDELAIGAPRYDGARVDSGAVFLWGVDGGVWKADATLEAPSIADGDQMGTSVALGGDVLYAGAPGENGGVSSWNGSTRRFFRLSGGAWSLTANLPPPDPGSAWYSGTALALDDGQLLVGSPGADDLLGPTAGAVQLWWSYDSSELTPPAYVGSDSNRCLGQVRLDTNLPALAPSTDFQVITEGLDPGLAGVLLVGFGVDSSGPDPFGLGISLYPELVSAPSPLVLAAQSDLPTAVPIPDGPNLVGLEVWLQSLWLDPQCGIGPLGLSASRCLALTIGDL